MQEEGSCDLSVYLTRFLLPVT